MLLQITPDERATLQSLADGGETGDIARSLGLPEREVEVQLVALFKRMGASTLTEAINAAVRRGLVQPSLGGGRWS